MTAFDRWYELNYGSKGKKNKYLAKKAWCYAMKWALVNIYNEDKVRKEIIGNKLSEKKEFAEKGIKFLRSEMK